jgi:tetratricopeptide (TPR) repeat protein
MPEAQTMVGMESLSEQSQLLQTIEMFEIILQSQPSDFQSLEILKEAYSKLGRQEDVIRTARRVAQAYVQLGQLSSAILEYESILQYCPDDPEVAAALAEIESSALSLQTPAAAEGEAQIDHAQAAAPAQETASFDQADIDDGRQTVYQLFVGSKLISHGDFDICWPHPHQPAGKIIDPFIQTLAERGTVPIDKSLKLMCDKSRLALLPMDKYDIDYELARTFPADMCRRWCVLPFDRMGRSVLVSTPNPFNRQVAKDLEARAKARLVWYLSPPQEIIRGLKKAFR